MSDVNQKAQEYLNSLDIIDNDTLKRYAINDFKAGYNSRDVEVSNLRGEIKDLVEALGYWIINMQNDELGYFRKKAQLHQQLISKYTKS